MKQNMEAAKLKQAYFGNDQRAPASRLLLRRTAFRDDCLQLPTVCSRDVDDNSCSHDESLNCFGRFWNRLNDH